MGRKDISEKILEAYDDVFSDIVNVLLFDGEQVLHPDELEEQAPRSAYKADGLYREIERDVAKRWKKENIRLACIGLENQTKPDEDMALRIMGYDGAEYRAQLLSDNPNRYPVVTLVLYFGHKNHWNAPRSLFERLEIPEKFKPYVNDYRVNLFEIAFLSRETVQKFQSDFRIVADYFVQMRETGDYIGSKETIRHVMETLSLLSVMTGDHRFEDVNTEPHGKEIHTMCEALDRIERRGIQQGMQQGMQQGIQQGLERGLERGRCEMAKNLRAIGMEISQIASVANVSVETVKRWLAEPAG